MDDQTKDQNDQLIEEVVPFTVEEVEEQMSLRGLSRKELTVQQERMVLLYVSGMSMAAAGRAAGYMSLPAIYNTFKRPYIQAAITFFREQMAEAVVFGREQAHAMYMEAWTVSKDATEMVKVTDSLVKLHRLVDPENSPQINIQVNNKTVERMSDEDLLKLIGKEADHLLPKAEK